MSKSSGRYILDTVPNEHDLTAYLARLDVDGVYRPVSQLTPLASPVEGMQLIFDPRLGHRRHTRDPGDA